MAELATHLHAQGLTVLAPLLAGHGATWQELEKSGWQDWYATAKDAFLNLKAQHKKVYVVGHSMGGLLTLKLAMDFPDQIAAAAVLCTPLFLESWVRLAVPLVRYSPLRYFYRHEKKSDNGDIKDRAAITDIWSITSMPLACVHSLMRLQKIIRENLKSVVAPLLVMHAREDHTAPYANLEAIAAGVGSKTVEKITLENSYHLVTLDYDKLVVQEKVAAFFSRF